MNKKGFTLVEVISVIAILALIIIVVATKGFGAFENSKKKIFDETMNQIKESANVLMVEVENCNDKLDEELLNSKLHILSDGTKLTCEKLKQQAESEECLTIPLKYLIEKKYITGSNASTIYETNPNMAFKGCIRNNKVNVECKENCEYTKPTTTTEANYPTVDFDYPSNKLLYISRTYPEINFTIEDLLKDLKVELNTKAYEKVQHTEIFFNGEPLCYPGNFKSFDYKSCGDYDVANMIKSLPEKETHELKLDVNVWIQDLTEEYGYKIISKSFDLTIKEVNPVINISYPEGKEFHYSLEDGYKHNITAEEFFSGLEIEMNDDAKEVIGIETIGIHYIMSNEICSLKGEYSLEKCLNGAQKNLDMALNYYFTGILPEDFYQYQFNDEIQVYVVLKNGIFYEERFSPTLYYHKKPKVSVTFTQGTYIQPSIEKHDYTFEEVLNGLNINVEEENSLEYINVRINDSSCEVSYNDYKNKKLSAFNICWISFYSQDNYDIFIDFKTKNWDTFGLIKTETLKNALYVNAPYEEQYPGESGSNTCLERICSRDCLKTYDDQNKNPGSNCCQCQYSNGDRESCDYLTSCQYVTTN